MYVVFATGNCFHKYYIVTPFILLSHFQKQQKSRKKSSKISSIFQIVYMEKMSRLSWNSNFPQRETIVHCFMPYLSALSTNILQKYI